MHAHTQIYIYIYIAANPTRGEPQDFDETVEKRSRGPGCDRKQSTQAMLRHLARQVQAMGPPWATAGGVDLVKKTVETKDCPGQIPKTFRKFNGFFLIFQDLINSFCIAWPHGLGGNGS